MSTDLAPSRKRVRRSEDEPTIPASSCIDTDVWLPDGNIIDQAGHVLFRVHQSTLALRSDVFREILASPLLALESGAMFDGCSIVQVDDSLDDVRRLLLVICCGKECVVACRLSSH